MMSAGIGLPREPPRAEPQAQAGHVRLPGPVDHVPEHHVRLQLRAPVHHAPADRAEPVERVLLQA